MSKYPKDYYDKIEAAFYRAGVVVRSSSFRSILRELEVMGLLKEPPKPREFWVAIHNGMGEPQISTTFDALPGLDHTYIKVREVLEDE